MRSGGWYAYFFCLGLEILLGTVCLGQNAAVIQAIRGNRNHLFVPMSINGQKEFWWLVDTGSSRFLIDTGAENTLIVAAIRQKEKIPFTDERLSLVGIHDFKKAPISGGTLPHFRLGNCALDKTFVGFTSLNLQPSEFSHAFGGLIGAEILYDHSAIIDLGHRALYLR